MTKFAVVDLANLFNRAFFATQGDAFTKAGMVVHTVFKSLRKLVREMEVKHIVFCVEGRSWRYDAYPAYKRQRAIDKMQKTASDKEGDEILYSAMDDFITFVSEKTNCTILQSDGIEGDDFIARWIQLHPDDEHVILSGDSDFIQLLALNVIIVDGVNERIIRCDGVTDMKGVSHVFHVNQANGKLKVGLPFEKARKEHDDKERARKKICLEGVAADPVKKKKAVLPSPYEKVPFSFTPEDDWWKKALFLKIIRGDTSDSILSAYPGVRYDGTKTKTGIKAAWDDRHERGFAWNNFMLQTWDKSVSEGLTESVKVIDAFTFNESLIDLTKQPDNVRDLMDVVIVQAVQKPRASTVGIAFLRFCNAQGLPNLAKEVEFHDYLSWPYGRT